jgi:putative peptide maturation dehydrogenase
MAQVRRSAWLLFFCEDGGFVDVAALLRGSLVPAPLRQLYAFSIPAGTETPIARAELDVLLALPAESSVDDGDLDPALIERWLAAGILVADGNGDQPKAGGWSLYAAAYHFLTRWRGVDLRDAEGDVWPANAAELSEFVRVRGPMPPHFHRLDDPRAVVELPLVQDEGGLTRTLAARRTTRNFDRARPLPLDDFAVALRQVFGCHGLAETADGAIVTLKRTSPSAGALHPIEAYPLVANVEGIDAGLYHYDAERHALEQLESFDGDAARALATQFVCGQTYFGDAHVLFLLVARFDRSYWKYRRHQKAYASILLDTGHLSQTLYLVAAERELGAFVTTVINNADIDERLGLDGVAMGTVAVSGLGLSAGRSPFDPVYRPFTSARA